MQAEELATQSELETTRVAIKSGRVATGVAAVCDTEITRYQ